MRPHWRFLPPDRVGCRPFSGCFGRRKQVFSKNYESELRRLFQRSTAMIVPTQIMLVIIEDPP